MSLALVFIITIYKLYYTVSLYYIAKYYGILLLSSLVPGIIRQKLQSCLRCSLMKLRSSVQLSLEVHSL